VAEMRLDHAPVGALAPRYRPGEYRAPPAVTGRPDLRVMKIVECFL